ncbi:MAG: ABC transporter substrate-binding protein [Desulfobacterales bacterium]|nr:ABC transporter substrate-binding protein [Desulfobacterales bacterium]
MKKCLSIIAVLTLLIGLPVLAPAAEEIEIALLYPLTGALAESGKRMEEAYQVAAEIINGSYDLPLPFAKTEGIPDLGGAKLKLKFYDTQGSPEIGKAETERILQEGKAKLIIGAYQSGVTKPTSFVAERQKFPYLCAESSSSALTERGLKYFFRLAVTDKVDSYGFMDFLDKQREAGKQVERIAMVYEKTEFGVHAAKEIKARIEERKGYSLVADVAHVYNSTDVNAEVLKVKAAKPDVIIHATLISDMMLFAKAYKNLGVQANANLSFCGGYHNPTFAKLGSDAEGYAGGCTFAPDFVQAKPHLKTVNDLFKARSGVDMDGITMEGFTALFVAADAFNRAKSTDPEAVTQALRATDLEIQTLPGNRIKFDENGQNIGTSSAISQIQGGGYRVVFPPDLATAPLMWPMSAK